MFWDARTEPPSSMIIEVTDLRFHFCHKLWISFDCDAWVVLSSEFEILFCSQVLLVLSNLFNKTQYLYMRASLII